MGAQNPSTEPYPVYLGTCIVNAGQGGAANPTTSLREGIISNIVRSGTGFYQLTLTRAVDLNRGFAVIALNENLSAAAAVAFQVGFSGDGLTLQINVRQTNALNQDVALRIHLFEAPRMN